MSTGARLGENRQGWKPGAQALASFPPGRFLLTIIPGEFRMFAIEGGREVSVYRTEFI